MKPYDNSKVPPYTERRAEIRRLQRRGYVLLSAWDRVIYDGRGRKMWGKALLPFTLFGRWGVVLVREGPSVERTGREW